MQTCPAGGDVLVQKAEKTRKSGHYRDVALPRPPGRSEDHRPTYRPSASPEASGGFVWRRPE